MSEMPELQPRNATTNQARALRRRATLAERTLWKLLRDRRLDGLKFRRQVPIGPYIADFICLKRRLILEADGPFHDPQSDALRDQALARASFRTLRFTVREILSEPDHVIARILAATESPSPLAGEGVRRTPDG
jgi:very-short-patch-repair endonuclease